MSIGAAHTAVPSLFLRRSPARLRNAPAGSVELRWNRRTLPSCCSGAAGHWRRSLSEMSADNLVPLRGASYWFCVVDARHSPSPDTAAMTKTRNHCYSNSFSGGTTYGIDQINCQGSAPTISDSMP